MLAGAGVDVLACLDRAAALRNVQKPNEKAIETHRVDTDEKAVETHRVDTDEKTVETHRECLAAQISK